jgi:hypothetical protein
MSKFSKFIRNFCSFTAASLLVIFSISFVADPYGIRKNGGRVNNDRLVKAIKVAQIKPETILLGSSGVARGLDPEHPILSKNSNNTVYNLSILGANIYELKRYFEHANANNNLETAVIGLDFYAFNRFREVRAGFSEARLGTKHLIPSDFLGIYLSLDSLNLILKPSERGLYFSENGTYEHPINVQMRHQFEVKLIEDFTQTEQMYWDYEFSKETVSHFQSITKIADEEAVNLKVFLPPIHATLFHSAMVDNYWATYENWLHEIVSIQPVWDFSGCNSITIEPVNEKMEYFEDPSHYTYKTGDLILSRMFHYRSDRVPKGFGVYITPDNIDIHLRNVKAQCQKWAEENPDIVRWLKDLNLDRHMTLSSTK